MAEELESNVTITTKESIARVELFTDAAKNPDDWELRAHFEIGAYTAQGNLVGATTFGSRRVERKFGAIKNESITAAGVTVTIAQLAALIQAGVYAFRAADIANPEGPQP